MVRLHGKWGVIDHAGQLVVPFEYDKLDGFEDAAITLGTRAGRELGVDRHGSVVELPPLGPLRGVPIDEL